MQQISDWNKLRDTAHGNAVEHGFWEDNPSDQHFLCLVISELMEAVEADRKSRRANVEWFNKRMKTSRICLGLDPDIPKEKGFEVTFNETIKDTIEDELADAIIRIMDLAGARNINMNVKDDIYPMFKQGKSSFTEDIYQIVQQLVRDDNPLEVSLNMCRMMICKLAYFKEIDIIWHIETKMKYNECREKLHGKKY